MNFVDAAAFALLVLPVVDWVVVVILIPAALQKPHISALTERAIASFVLAVAASGVAWLVFARLFGRQISPTIASVILIGALFALSIPAVLWLRVHLTTGFGHADE